MKLTIYTAHIVEEREKFDGSTYSDEIIPWALTDKELDKLTEMAATFLEGMYANKVYLKGARERNTVNTVINICRHQYEADKDEERPFVLPTTHKTKKLADIGTIYMSDGVAQATYTNNL